jgi:hypothetical protein
LNDADADAEPRSGRDAITKRTSGGKARASVPEICQPVGASKYTNIPIIGWIQDWHRQGGRDVESVHPATGERTAMVPTLMPLLSCLGSSVFDGRSVEVPLSGATELIGDFRFRDSIETQNIL